MRFIFLAITIFSVMQCSIPATQESQTKILTDKSTHTVAFYNVENLFDTFDDRGVGDGNFTPDGYLNWTKERYQTKLENIAKVLSSLNDNVPTIIGLAEVENKKTLEDLLNTSPLSNFNLKIVHEDGADTRGIDCALIYNADYFELDSWKSFDVPIFPVNADIKTRDIVYVKGTILDEIVHIYVNHWPSRRDGTKESEFKREHVADFLSEKVNDIISDNEDANIIIMGDFNDEPTNQSIQSLILKTKNLKPVPTKGNEGTINHQGNWLLFDHFITSNSLMDDKKIDLTPNKSSIFFEEWILYTNPKYKDQKPNRTYGGKNYYGGYSDHLPVWIEISNE